MSDQRYWRPAVLCLVVLLGITVVLGEGSLRGLRVVGAIVGALALPLMFLPFATLKRYGDVGPGETYMATRQLVDRGLFAVVRHPQYLGYMHLALSFALLSQRWYAVVLALGACSFLYLHAVREESVLRKRLGLDYQTYAARVPRFNLALGLWRVISAARK
jgi:protein-S-isoprenylcysteine O-methyltransferase Ste14